MALLTWAPPTGWASYTSRAIPAAGGTISLTDGVDYKLIAPNAPITGPVVITGGRNVVWIGGFIGGRTSAPSLTSSYDSSNRGIRITADAGSANRIIFIEGLMALSGTYLSDLIQVYAGGAPVSGMTLYVQNINDRAWHWGNNVTSPNVHADVIQFYSGPTNFFLDRLTADHCTYQGLYLDARNYAGTGVNPGGTKLPWEVKHVNLFRETSGGTGQPSSQPLGLNKAASWANVQNTEIYVNGGFKSVASFGGWPINSELHEGANPPGGDFVTGADWNTGTYVYTSPGYIGSVVTGTVNGVAAPASLSSPSPLITGGASVAEISAALAMSGGTHTITSSGVAVVNSLAAALTLNTTTPVLLAGNLYPPGALVARIRAGV